MPRHRKRRRLCGDHESDRQPFPVLADVGEYLGVQPGRAKTATQGGTDRSGRIPSVATLWQKLVGSTNKSRRCVHPGLTAGAKETTRHPRATEAFGGRLCRWPNQRASLSVHRPRYGRHPKAVLAYRVDGNHSQRPKTCPNPDASWPVPRSPGCFLAINFRQRQASSTSAKVSPTRSTGIRRLA